MAKALEMDGLRMFAIGAVPVRGSNENEIILMMTT